MRFRFTIRDLLWFTAVVAVVVAWRLDHERLKPKMMLVFPRGPIIVEGEEEEPIVKQSTF
jgi:hypothetical protein